MRVAAGLLPMLLAACATAPLTESGRLSSYAGLQPSNGVLTRTKVFVDSAAMLAARSTELASTSVAETVSRSGLSPKQLRLVSNAIDRALCRELSRRFVVLAPGQSADAVVHGIITHIGATDVDAAGASAILSIGGTVASVATGVPVPKVRLPFGLGSLSVEAEARDRNGRQLAALIWARGADAIMTKPRVAPEGDAYTLASAFAADFAKLLVTGTDPVANPMPLPPSVDSVGQFLGGKPKHAACEAFGRDPGLGDVVGGAIGLPPDLTDQGPR